VGEGLKWTQCTFLQESEAGYLPTLSSDTDQSSPLNGTNTLAKSCENEPQTDGSLTCQCGKGTLGCLIHPNTPAEWIAFMQDSLAKTLALLESKQVYKKEPDQGFTEKSCVSLAWYDRATCSWKTYQRSLVTDWEPYSETWPRWGMTQGGSAYAHPTSEHGTTAIDGSAWLPTIGANEFRGTSKKRYRGSDEFRGAKMCEGLRTCATDPTYLHPLFGEYAMGFPSTWTELKESEMLKRPSRQQQHGDYSEAAE
jgi:hypothetical protein